MSASDEHIPEFVAVVCPVCRTRMDARVRDAAGSVDCPDCLTAVRVPALAEVIAARPKRIEVPDPGAYGIAVEPEHPREEARRKEVAESETAAISCPYCRCRLTPDLYDRRRNITCPDCLEVIEVPTRSEWLKKHKPLRKRPIADPSPYGLTDEPAGVSPPIAGNPSAESKPEPVANPFDAMAEVRRAQPAFLPQWTFFTRVFSLPWRADGLRCWIQFSLGSTTLGFFIAVLHWLIVGGMIVVIPFFALPAIWVTFWVVSYGISSGVTILEETANGRDEISEWNDGGWSAWMTDSFAPGFLATVTWMISFYTAKLGSLIVGDGFVWPMASILFLLFFPVVLLSSLEAGSAFVPLSWPVVRTLFRHAILWLCYFTLAVGVAAVYFLPTYLGLSAGAWFVTLLLTGPLLAAVVMIEARLLGRLAWKAIVFDGRAKRRRKKKGTAKPADESQHTRKRRSDENVRKLSSSVIPF